MGRNKSNKQSTQMKFAKSLVLAAFAATEFTQAVSIGQARPDCSALCDSYKACKDNIMTEAVTDMKDDNKDFLDGLDLELEGRELFKALKHEMQAQLDAGENTYTATTVDDIAACPAPDASLIADGCEAKAEKKAERIEKVRAKAAGIANFAAFLESGDYLNDNHEYVPSENEGRRGGRGR